MRANMISMLAVIAGLLVSRPVAICDEGEIELRAEAAATAFIHTATSANTSGNCTTINNSATNGKSGAILQVTQNWAPMEVYNDSPVGVRYRNGKWSICNQDLSPVPEFAAFNVKVLNPGRKVFVHKLSANISWASYTTIDHRSTNGKSGVLLQVTPAYLGRGRYDSHPIGTYYDTTYRYWEILHEDLAGFTRNSAYNVEVLRPGSSNLTHTATAGNTFSNYTIIDNPASNGRPSAKLIVTQLAIGYPLVYNNHAIGVWYHYSGRWSIFNQDREAMPAGATFTVSVIE